MKVWMWQRLWKGHSGERVFETFGEFEDDPWLHCKPGTGIYSDKWHWLCPKPNLVLVDRKHLGGME